MKNIKLSFLDFWTGFDPYSNFFTDMIKTLFNVEVVSPEICDVLIFSCFGNRNQEFMNKKRIFYTGENIRPSYDVSYRTDKGFYIGKCDYSFTFDFSEDNRNIRIPLWLLQIDWFDKKSYGNPKFLIPYNQLNDNDFMRKEKSKFCSFVFNSNAPYRYEIVEELSKYKKVDCYGKPHNNWFYGEDKKISIISDYKFNICFENSIYPGYYTEKPIHAKYSGCVPVYWSDKNMSIDFNRNAFLNLNDFSSIEELCKKIIELDENNEEYHNIKNQPMFLEEQNPKEVLDKIVDKVMNILK